MAEKTWIFLRRSTCRRMRWPAIGLWTVSHGIVRHFSPRPHRSAMRRSLADFIDQQCRLRGAEGHLRIFPRARRALRQGPVQASRNFRRPATCRAGGPIRSGSRWSPNWSKACCAPLPPATTAGSVEALARSCSAIFDRYPVPAALGERSLAASLRAELEHRLKLIGLHPPKWAKDVPEQFCGELFRPHADPREAARPRLPDDRATTCG